MKDNKAVVVFTGKDLNIMRAEGGSGYWLAKAERLNDAKYLIAVRNRRETWAVKDLEHGTGFLIAKITGCFKNPDYDDRNVITFEEYAEISVKKAWKMLTGGQRYPVAYLTAEEAFFPYRDNARAAGVEKTPDFNTISANPLCRSAEKTKPQRGS